MEHLIRKTTESQEMSDFYGTIAAHHHYGELTRYLKDFVTLKIQGSVQEATRMMYELFQDENFWVWAIQWVKLKVYEYLTDPTRQITPE